MEVEFGNPDAGCGAARTCHGCWLFQSGGCVLEAKLADLALGERAQDRGQSSLEALLT
jgi:hypothetical protein